MIITLILFILILGLLIFVHEFGHFWVAKKLGVKVHEFAFGFKPRLIAWKRGSTEYAINLIPLGGYVRLEGEQEDTGKKGSFMGQPPRKRAAILAAGVIMNLILAWVLLVGAYGVGSYALSPTFADHPGVQTSSEVLVVYVTPDSPAQKAGLQPKDRIIKVNDTLIQSHSELVEISKHEAGHEIVLTYKHDTSEATVTLVPRKNPEPGQGALGIGTAGIETARTSWLQAPIVALQEVGSEIRYAFTGFVGFIRQLAHERKVSEDVSGIVGIGAMTGEVRRLGLGPLLQFVALISTNLAVINILPILPLDGGHLFFLGLESIRKKPVHELIRHWVTITGLAAVLLLFLIVTYQDILRYSIIDRLRNIF